MDHIKALANQVEWAAGNLVYNLSFIPADKLAWKPAPTAPSALEIVAHAMGVFAWAKTLLSGGSISSGSTPNRSEPVPAVTAEEAGQRLTTAAHEYAEMLRGLSEKDLGKKIDLHFGTMPLAFVASMPVTDLIHHHGQIAYIQMMLGDTESHFDLSLLSQG